MDTPVPSKDPEDVASAVATVVNLVYADAANLIRTDAEYRPVLRKMDHAVKVLNADADTVAADPVVRKLTTAAKDYADAVANIIADWEESNVD